MFDELNEIINVNLLRMFTQLCTYSTLRWKKRTSRKKGLRVKSSEANMFKRFLYLLQLQGMAPKLLSHGVFLFKFNKKDKNLPVK